VAENDVILGVAVETKKAVESLAGFQKAAVVAFGAVAAAAAAVFAGGKLLSGFGATIDAANENANAINRMNQSLVSSGDYSKAASESMREFASSISSVVGIDDDLIYENLALAKSFGATNDQAKKVVKAAADMSAALGIDLSTATQQLSGTLNGTIGKMGKLAPELKNLSQEALASGAAIELLGKRFSGSAEAATKTFSGEINKSALAFDDLKTQIGFAITQNPIFRKAIQQSTKVLAALAEIVANNQEKIADFIKNGVELAITGVRVLASAFAALGAIMQQILQPITSTISVLGKGISTLVFASKYIINTSRLLGSTSKEANDNMDQLVANFEALDKVGNFNFEALTDGLAQSAFDFSQQVEDSITGLKPIPVSLDPVINMNKVKEDFSKAFAEFPSPNNANFQFDPLVLPQAGPVTPTDAQMEAARTQLEAAKKQEEAVIANSSAVISSLAKGGKEGAQQLLATVGVGIATALGAGPFAQLVGELITLLTTDGVVKLVKSLVDNIDDVIKVLAENIPQVAVALAMAIGNPLFTVRLVNAVIDGFTTGIDKAFKDAMPDLIKNISNIVAVFGSLFNDATGGFGNSISNAGLDFASKISTAFDNAALKITGIFDDIGNAFNDFIDRITGGGVKSEGTKISGKFKATYDNAFSLTGDAGTIQSKPTGFGLTGASSGGDVNTAILNRILFALEKPVSVTSRVSLDNRVFADIILDLSRRNARTA
jgi:hypothetical protein